MSQNNETVAKILPENTEINEGKKRIVAINRKIAGHARNKELNEAMMEYLAALDSGLANNHTFASCINANVRCGDILGATKVFNTLRQKKGIKLDEITCTTMIKGYSSVGNLKANLEIFEGMWMSNPKIIPNIRTVNSFLRGCVISGFIEEGDYILQKIQKEYKIAPDASTWEYIISLYSQGLLIDKILPLIGRLQSDNNNTNENSVQDSMSVIKYHTARSFLLLGNVKGSQKLLNAAIANLDSIELRDIENAQLAASNHMNEQLHSNEIHNGEGDDSGDDANDDDDEIEEEEADTKDGKLESAKKRKRVAGEGVVAGGGKRAWRTVDNDDARAKSLQVYKEHRALELRQDIKLVERYIQLQQLQTSKTSIFNITESIIVHTIQCYLRLLVFPLQIDGTSTITSPINGAVPGKDSDVGMNVHYVVLRSLVKRFGLDVLLGKYISQTYTSSYKSDINTTINSTTNTPHTNNTSNSSCDHNKTKSTSTSKSTSNSTSDRKHNVTSAGVKPDAKTNIINNINNGISNTGSVQYSLLPPSLTGSSDDISHVSNTGNIGTKGASKSNGASSASAMDSGYTHIMSITREALRGSHSSTVTVTKTDGKHLKIKNKPFIDNDLLYRQHIVTVTPLVGQLLDKVCNILKSYFVPNTSYIQFKNVFHSKILLKEMLNLNSEEDKNGTTTKTKKEVKLTVNEDKMEVCEAKTIKEQKKSKKHKRSDIDSVIDSDSTGKAAIATKLQDDKPGIVVTEDDNYNAEDDTIDKKKLKKEKKSKKRDRKEDENEKNDQKDQKVDKNDKNVQKVEEVCVDTKHSKDNGSDGSDVSDLPVHLEICSGAGEWVVQQALQSNGKLFWASLEMRNDRVYQTFTRAMLENVDNLVVLGGDATSVIPNHIAANSLHGVYVNYPEPPQQHGGNTSQSKHLFSDNILAELERCLVPGGILTILTDNLWYAKLLLRIISNMPNPRTLENNDAVNITDASNTVYVFEEQSGINLYCGKPGIECGHISESSSYFDRLWNRGMQSDRYFIALKKGEGNPYESKRYTAKALQSKRTGTVPIIQTNSTGQSKKIVFDD